MSEENRANVLPPQNEAAGGPVNGAAAPAPAPAFAAPCPPVQRPVRRVGTLTLGLALIATGLAITAWFFVPGFDIVFFAKLAPLVLVFLGAEVLWAAVHPDGRRIKFDFLSAFVAFVLICASLAAATLPAVWRWYGPDRAFTEQRLADELEEQFSVDLKGQDILRCDVWVNLGSVEFDRQMTPADLRAGDQVGVNITLGGTVENADDFAARVAALLPAIDQAGATQAYFFWGDDADQWDLDLSGAFEMGAGADSLARLARHQVYVTDADGDGFWAGEEEAASLAAGGDAASGQSAPASDPEPASEPATEPAAETAPDTAGEAA